MPAFLNITLNIIGPIFIVVGLAVLFDRFFSPDPRVLSRLVIYLFTPCLVFNSLAKSDLQASEMGRIVIMAVLSIMLVTMGSWGLARLCRFDHQLQTVFLLSVTLINAGNYGLPLNEFAFGRDGVERAVVFYVVTAVISYTVGVYLASRGTASMGQSLFNMLRVPLPYATVLGIAANLSGVSLPTTVERVATLLGQAAIPSMMVILGTQLAHTSIKGRVGPILLASAMRLLVAPLVAWPLAYLLGLSPLSRQVSILQASMPTAVVSGVLATEFGNDPHFPTAVVLVSTLVSIPTLSFLLYLIS